MENTFLQTLLIALAVGFVSGSIGSFIIIKRMALVGDALSHVALPGIALALAYEIDPFWGVVAFLTVAAILIWWLEKKTKLPAEALVGLLFTASLAVGILTIPDTEILESLFGEFPEFTPLALILILSVAALASMAVFVFARRFLEGIIAKELILGQRKRRKYDLSLFLIFALAVALGIKLVGTLLMGALTIIPAAIAKNITGSMKGYILLSALLGGFISFCGVILAGYFKFLPGPTIILLGVGLFVFSLIFVKK